ncbi:phosphatidylserine decarboxylase family protein [Porphyromonas sp. COT-290 OH860]|uniref:phosphatidylserine decarboxylase family protein n=1 Tax=Porphyromonas sp. COT-290 OH860 TaxID=1515615 RepID=UPI00052C74AB|nr:phosphatidylserine decarboxylase family protein [Porphyromonas sp. COT-290 OH860]KGN84261.1 phosphatidylserine decarboxylase [Porphyromonas sp. COT-290 OH860]
MTLHKEGTCLLIGIGISLALFCATAYMLSGAGVAFYIILAISAILYALVLNFFRYIPRKHPEAANNRAVVCPADGKVVVIEEVDEQEIMGCRCLQVSVFMNVFNMHVNWIPVNGTVEHVSHNKGRFLAAHLPKSSTENERSAVVIRTPEGHRVLARQIAGAVAQRIVTYPEVGHQARINDNLGFIKFGSRVDLYLPLGSEVCVKLGQKVDGNVTMIARLPE